MKVLVTGVTGKFGPHVVRELINNGHEAVLFSRKTPPEEFKELEWIRGDMHDYNDCFAALRKKGFDAIQNTAAKPYPTDTPGAKEREDPSLTPITMQTNIMGLYNLLHAAVRNDVGVFVHTSSNCVLGHGFRFSGRAFEIKYLPIDESHPSDAEDSYSFSKLVGEQLMESYTRTYGIRCYALRAAGISDASRRADLKTNIRPAAGWDEWMFPWIASEDLASAHRLLMEQAGSITKFGAYYCNNDDTRAIEPTMEIIRRFRPDLIHVIKEPLEGHATLFSNKLLKAAVGWKPLQSWR